MTEKIPEHLLRRLEEARVKTGGYDSAGMPLAVDVVAKKDAEIAALKQRVRELEAELSFATTEGDDSVPTAEQVALDCMAALQKQFGNVTFG